MSKKKPKPEPVAEEVVTVPETDSQLLRTDTDPVVQTSQPQRNTLTAEEIRIAHHLAEWGRK